MPEDLGTWQPAVAVLAIVAYAFNAYLKYLTNKDSTGLRDSDIVKLGSTLTAVQVAIERQTESMEKLTEATSKLTIETRDLWNWHKAEDPTTGQKRWYNDPLQKVMVAEMHTWMQADRQSGKGNGHDID